MFRLGLTLRIVFIVVIYYFIVFIIIIIIVVVSCCFVAVNDHIFALCLHNVISHLQTVP